MIDPATATTHATMSSLFLLSFLAATVLPLGSEWLLVLLVARGESPVTAVLIASCGNYLGSCTTYTIGYFGAHFLMEKVLRMNRQSVERAARFFTRYGSWSLLMSWLPVVGDPLCLIAGTMRTHLLRFSVLVFTGKLFRYATLAFLTIQGTGVTSSP